MLRRFEWVELGVGLSLASAGVANAQTFGFNDITNWTGTGSNEAAMIIQWNSPLVLNNTSVPAPSQNLELAFGYKFNGTTNAGAMMDAILAHNPNLYAINSGGSYNAAYQFVPTGSTFAMGAYIYGIGYHTDSGAYAVTDGNTTYSQSSFVNGALDGYVNYNYNPDSFYAADANDVYWGGMYGPNWQLWTESGDSGGFTSEPDRGSNPYWTTTDGWDGSQGQWDLTSSGLSSLSVTQGSWLGWTVAGGGLDYGVADAGTNAYMYDAQAPALISVPEPASLGLLVTAGVGLLARRRARR